MKTQRSSDGRLNFNPRSLIRLHGIQLAAHDSQLAASQAGLQSSDSGIGGDYYDTRERHPKYWLVVVVHWRCLGGLWCWVRDGVASGIVADGGPMTDLGLSGPCVRRRQGRADVVGDVALVPSPFNIP